MTTSRIRPERTSFTSPIIDYEPPPEQLGRRLGAPPACGGPTQVGVTPCPPPSPAALHRRTRRPLRPVALHPVVSEPPPPRAAVVFADAALRRVLEIVDRRRPTAQLRPLIAPALIDTVVALTRSPHTASATLRRVRLRVTDGDGEAAEVFATYTRAGRVHAIAARVEMFGDRWRIVALQIG